MATFPLILFEQYTKNNKSQTFRINKSERTIEINGKKVDMKVLETFINERDLDTFFETITFVKADSTIFGTPLGDIDIIITKTFSKGSQKGSKEGVQEVSVKADFNYGKSGYKPIIIECLERAIIEAWNNLFRECFAISQYNDCDILKAVSELYHSRRSSNPELKDFHEFTMNILKAQELTPLEDAYKEYIRRIFKMPRFEDDTLILFSGISAKIGECYLSLTSYVRLTGITTRTPAYQPCISKFGKFHMPSFREAPLSIASFEGNSGMTTAKEIVNIFAEESF